MLAWKAGLAPMRSCSPGLRVFQILAFMGSRGAVACLSEACVHRRVASDAWSQSPYGRALPLKRDHLWSMDYCEIGAPRLPSFESGPAFAAA